VESRRAVLTGYKLTFDSRGYADIIEDMQSNAYGAVYLITLEQLDKLDVYEGVRLGVYVRKKVSVTSNSEKFNAITYIRKEKTKFKEPEDWYLQLIINGLKEHGYDEGAISYARRCAKQISE